MKLHKIFSKIISVFIMGIFTISPVLAGAPGSDEPEMAGCGGICPESGRPSGDDQRSGRAGLCAGIVLICLPLYRVER